MASRTCHQLVTELINISASGALIYDCAPGREPSRVSRYMSILTRRLLRRYLRSCNRRWNERQDFSALENDGRCFCTSCCIWKAAVLHMHRCTEDIKHWKERKCSFHMCIQANVHGCIPLHMHTCTQHQHVKFFTAGI